MFKWLYGPALYLKADRLGTYASALAYCFVLSLVPFLAVTFAVGMEITSQLAVKNDEFARSFAGVLSEVLPMDKPEDMQQILNAIEHSTKGGLVTIGFILAVYTSYNLMDQIIRTLHFIFDDPRRPHEWSWRQIVKALALLGVWMCLLLLISVTALGATGLRHLLNLYLLKSLSEALVTCIQLGVIIAALFGTFYFTYFVVPPRAYKRKYVIEGSMLASCGWIACSLVFASVLPPILKTSAAYIALGSVVAILLWAQACAWSIILGACWIVRFAPKPR